MTTSSPEIENSRHHLPSVTYIYAPFTSGRGRKNTKNQTRRPIIFIFNLHTCLSAKVAGTFFEYAGLYTGRRRQEIQLVPSDVGPQTRRPRSFMRVGIQLSPPCS